MHERHSAVASLLVGIFILVLSLFAMGCSEGEKPAEPVKDPAKALKALAIVIDSQFFNQVDIVRSQLNGAQQGFAPFIPTSERTEQNLASLVINSADRLWWAGVIDMSGFVRNVYPDSMAQFLDENRLDILAVQAVLDDEKIDVGPVLYLADGRTSIDYYRTVLEVNSIVGAIFGGVAIDTLVQRSLLYVDLSDSTSRHSFVVDDAGKIVYDENPELVGTGIRDAEAFDEIGLLADDMEAESEGSDIYVLSGIGAGDGEGEYYVGWKRRVLLGDHFLIFVVTEFHQEISSTIPF